MKRILFLLAFLFAFPVSASTIPEGAIVKNVSSPDVYIIKYSGGNAYKRLVLNPKVFESYGHLKWKNLITISDEELAYQFINSDLVRVDGDTQIYQLIPYGDTGTRKKLPAGTEYNPNSVYTINSVDFNNYGSTETEVIQSNVTSNDTSTRAAYASPIIAKIVEQVKIMNTQIDILNENMNEDMKLIDDCYENKNISELDRRYYIDKFTENYNESKLLRDKIMEDKSRLGTILYEIDDYVKNGAIFPAADRGFLLSLGITW